MFSPINSYIKKFCGSKNTVILGFAILGLNSLGLGMITKVSDARVYMWVSVLMRFLQGFGDNLINITCFCIITQIFRDDMMLWIGRAEVAIGLGLGIGPWLGQIIFDLFDTRQFEFTMYSFAAINFLAAGFCYSMFPAYLNDVVEQDDDLISEDSYLKKNEITWWNIISIKENAFALASIIFVTYTVYFDEAWISTYLITIPGFEESWVGLAMSIPALVGLFSFWFFPILFEESPRKLMFVIGHIGCMVSCFLLGPS